MTIEPFEITTTYADGRVEKRWSTSEELAQREADLAQFELDRIAREEAIAKAETDRASARVKLAALGLTEDEVAALVK